METNPYTLQLAYFDRMLAIRDRGIAVDATYRDLLDEIDAKIAKANAALDAPAEIALRLTRDFVAEQIDEDSK